MTAPAIGPAARYVAAGVTQIYWVGTIAVLSAPTRSELNAGVDLSGEVADTGGWTASATFNPSNRLASGWEMSRRGRRRAEGTTITLYADRAGDDIRALLAEGNQGHIVVLHGGDIAGRLMDVWPVEVAALSQPTTIGNDPAQVVAEFAVPDEPVLGVTVPA